WIEGLFGAPGGEFVRTPKHGIEGQLGSWIDKRYASLRNFLPLFEIGFACYFACAFWIAASDGRWLTLPFLALFLFGFGYVGVLSLAHGRVVPRAASA